METKGDKSARRCGITPTYVKKLKENEVFVFGSNLQGAHGGGAALTAMRLFGAVWGRGTGLQGQSYAIPTMQGGVETIRPYVDEFTAFAAAHPGLHFLVTRIGCGIAGFSDSDIAPLFAGAAALANVSLPQEFLDAMLGGAEFPIGAMAGDIIGSVHEFRPVKSTAFELFPARAAFTDDTVMTVAVADWLTNGGDLARVMQGYGRRYAAGYGGMFNRWIASGDPQPYNSFGNGSAMRVSPVGWAFGTLEETLQKAEESAAVTHNHPEGIKGAQATAACIFLARTGCTKEEMRMRVEADFGYGLHRTCDEIRPAYSFDVTCQASVPEAIIAFLDSTDFESAVRLAVSLGGDADTQGAIAGSIAEAYYGGVPAEVAGEVMSRLPDEFKEVMSAFARKVMRKRQP